MCQFSQWTGERKLIWLTNVKSRDKEYPTSGMKCPSWSVLCSYLLRTLCPVVCVNGCSVCFITELSWMPTRLRCREGDTLPPLEVTAAPSLCQAGAAGMGRCWESQPVPVQAGLTVFLLCHFLWDDPWRRSAGCGWGGSHIPLVADECVPLFGIFAGRQKRCMDEAKQRL